KAFDSIFLIDPSSVKARNNLGIIYKRLGRYNDALRVYSEAESIVKNEFGPSSPELARLYMNIGIIYNQKQDYELALQYLNFAESLFRVSNIQTEEASIVYNNIGNSYFGMRDWRKALQSYQKGIQVKKALNFGGLHIAYANCASTYETLGKLDSARMYYDYSIQSKIERWGPENIRLISTYNNYGVLLQNMGEGELALQYLEGALELATEYYSEKHPEKADCHIRIGAWYLEEGNTGQALEYYQKGVNAVVFDYNNPDIYDNPLLDAEIISEPVFLKVLLGKANALAILYQQNQEIDALIASLATLELANMLAEKMRSAYLGQESKLFITEYARTGFDRSIRTAFDLYKLTGELEYANKAFTYAEKSKSSVLLASLQEVENKKDLGIPSELQVFEQDLKRETDTYKKKLYEEKQGLSPDSLKLARLQGKLLNLSQQLDSLDDVIREKFPEFATKYNNEVIGLKGVMNGLDSEHVLVEYSLSDSSLFIFVVSNEDYYITSLLIDSSFHKNVDALSRFLRNNDFNNNTIDDYRTYLHAGYYLYRTFLLPVEEQILGKKLIIIPDGELGYIPFEALLTELPSEEMMDYRTLPYLIYKYRTNYSYSATLHFSDNNRQAPPPKQLLA
ncbi:MAG: tetratricopeptide repeat protein, partial [Bacteroidales bacterium]|nr:tetratricopeptide repeat protein [Bacteroidales bacterium]